MAQEQGTRTAMSGRGGSAPGPPPVRHNQANGVSENHGREVGHNENALWESTDLFYGTK